MLLPAELIGVRTRFGLGRESFARLLGVAVASIHRWERGDTGPTGPVLQFYRAAKSALDRGVPREELLVDVGGDPGRVLARVFALGFLEDSDASRGPVRSSSRVGQGRLRARPPRP